MLMPRRRAWNGVKHDAQLAQNGVKRGAQLARNGVQCDVARRQSKFLYSAVIRGRFF
jgi:hypothetical protein